MVYAVYQDRLHFKCYICLVSMRSSDLQGSANTKVPTADPVAFVAGELCQAATARCKDTSHLPWDEVKTPSSGARKP
jgi:hypothetical protein